MAAGGNVADDDTCRLGCMVAPFMTRSGPRWPDDTAQRGPTLSWACARRLVRDVGWEGPVQDEAPRRRVLNDFADDVNDAAIIVVLVCPRRADCPVGYVRVAAPVVLRHLAIHQGIPERLWRGGHVGHVDKPRLIHGASHRDLS